MTALDLHERIVQIEQFNETLRILHKQNSNWNEEFGEGSLIAHNLKLIINEYENELKHIKQELDMIQVEE